MIFPCCACRRGLPRCQHSRETPAERKFSASIGEAPAHPPTNKENSPPIRFNHLTAGSLCYTTVISPTIKKQ